VGQKVHPVGFRLGIIRDWEAKWYAEKDYARLLHEDLKIRKSIRERLLDAGIPRIEIERSANNVTVTIHTARPGIVIGRGGQKVEELRKWLEKMTGKRVRLNIHEIRNAETDAYLVARSIAEQIERRVAFRRAIKQASTRAMQRGAKGIRIVIAGRLGGAEMSRRERESNGKVPLQTLRADIDFATAEAHTTYGVIGIKVWIYRGDILPEQKVAPAPRLRAQQAPAPAQPAQPVQPAPAAETPSATVVEPQVTEQPTINPVVTEEEAPA
jgi:small subunit ribosomal protein S3